MPSFDSDEASQPKIAASDKTSHALETAFRVCSWIEDVMGVKSLEKALGWGNGSPTVQQRWPQNGLERRQL